MTRPEFGFLAVTTICLELLWRFPQRLLIVLIKAYRLLLSPWLGACCRFEPSCSVYALQALQDKGACIGTCLTLHRLVRCNPWCSGGHDPVHAKPQAESRQIFSRLLRRANTHLPSEKTLP